MKFPKTIAIALLLVATLAFHSMAQTPVPSKSLKLIDQLVGKWQLSQVYDGAHEIDTSKQKGVMREIEFTEEAKYISTVPKLDSGYFRTNEDHHILYLENIIGSNHKPDEWFIKLDEPSLVLTRKQPAKMKRYKYVYVRQPYLEKAKR